MTVGHAMSFAKLRERVRGRVRVHACVHVRGGVETGRKTRKVEREREARNGEQRETRVEFISCSKEREREKQTFSRYYT